MGLTPNYIIRDILPQDSFPPALGQAGAVPQNHATDLRAAGILFVRLS